MTLIAVYADWESLGGPRRLGWLHVGTVRAVSVFEFEYDPAALLDPELTSIALDPRIGRFAGRQFSGQQQNRFGVFADSSPDLWGHLLMQRRLERDIRDGLAPAGTRLQDADLLLGVHDLYRVGALRYRLDDQGPFLDDRDGLAAPPFVELRALEQASRALENDPHNSAADGGRWLRMLIAPGGSLGGARPKASVADDKGHLWIAKFPSVRDEHDVGAWEMLVNALASHCWLAGSRGHGATLRQRPALFHDQALRPHRNGRPAALCLGHDPHRSQRRRRRLHRRQLPGTGRSADRPRRAAPCRPA